MQPAYLTHVNQYPQQSQPAGGHGQPNDMYGGPSGEASWAGPYPSLHLWPIQDTFQMKTIHLPEGQRVKVGRQTNNKTVPGERNAYFDSKVLSRLHAEIWEEGGKVYVRDIQSSNGTFINGERLSPEGMESEPMELKNEDQVEFGIDIVSDDNRTIVHHRVAAKAYIVFNDEDATRSAREIATYHQNDNSRMRRIADSHSNLNKMNPMAQMGPPMMSGGGKAGSLSFEHVLSKLQAELHASKETGSELQNLASTFNGIQDTLSGGVPPSANGSAAEFIPVQFRSASAEAQAALEGPHGQEAAAFIALQSQLNETQTSLSGHLEKIRYLESQLKEHETLKSEVQTIREQMEESKMEMDMVLAGHRGRQLGRRGSAAGDGEGEEEDDDDDDDARSVATLMDDEESESRVRERRTAERQRRQEAENAERPNTPEPTGVNSDDDDHDQQLKNVPSESATVPVGGLTSREKEMLEQNNHLVSQINTLSTEISEALTLSQALQSQHAEAMSAVKVLSQRISSLEDGLSSKISEEVGKAEGKWDSWRAKFEENWKNEREGWEKERERLRSVVREWEEASRRAHEEEEERRENERLSEDEYLDEEDGEDGDDDDDQQVVGGVGMPNGSVDWKSAGSSPLAISPASRKTRRRRQSHKTILAVRALQAVADGESTIGPCSSTKAILADTIPEGNRTPSSPLRSRNRKLKGGGDLTRNGSDRILKNGRGEGGSDDLEGEKDNSESGRESQETLKDDALSESKKDSTKKKFQQQIAQPQTVVGVLVVAIVVGAFWYKHKE